jgi:hypothetical protein
MTFSESTYTPGRWRTSSYSGSAGSCVEVKHCGDVILVRDSKDWRARLTIDFPAIHWHSFLEGIGRD